jgi:hypothetical protein
VIAYRQCDRRYPFLWESTDQPAARWNAAGAGPVQYFASTPDGAWAEFVRHEEIVDEADLLGIRRAMWAVDLPHEPDDFSDTDLPETTLTGGLDSYAECQAEAQRLKNLGRVGLRAPSAALVPGAAGGYRVELGFRPGPRRDGDTYVVFGVLPFAVGWQVVDEGWPPAALLPSVRPLA